jgi:hypothetical protein
MAELSADRAVADMNEVLVAVAYDEFTGAYSRLLRYWEDKLDAAK